jgi:hypothetical protein
MQCHPNSNPGALLAHGFLSSLLIVRLANAPSSFNP